MGKCKKCGGDGEVPVKYSASLVRLCVECGGTGKAEKPKCPDCGQRMKYSGLSGWQCPDLAAGYICRGRHQNGCDCPWCND